MRTKPDGDRDAQPDIATQRAYYDERWRHATYANLLQLQRAMAILDGLRTLRLRIPRILDLGCGTGWLAAILGRFGPTTGVDLSPVAIRRAQALYPDVEFMAGDFFELPLSSDVFDVAVSVQVIDHMEDQARFVRLLARVLKRGGHVLLITNNAWNLSHWTDAALDDFSGGLQPIEKWLTAKQLKELLAPHFKVKRLDTILAGYGHRGIFRLVNSGKAASALRRLGLSGWYERVLLRAGFGLLLFAVAERR